MMRQRTGPGSSCAGKPGTDLSLIVLKGSQSCHSLEFELLDSRTVRKKIYFGCVSYPVCDTLLHQPQKTNTEDGGLSFRVRGLLFRTTIPVSLRRGRKYQITPTMSQMIYSNVIIIKKKSHAAPPENSIFNPKMCNYHIMGNIYLAFVPSSWQLILKLLGFPE